MDHCHKIPGAAWQLLAQAQWEKLTKASFAGRLGEGALAWAKKYDKHLEDRPHAQDWQWNMT